MTNLRLGFGLAAIAMCCGLAKASVEAQAPIGVQEPAWAPVLQQLQDALVHWQTATNDPWLLKYQHQ